MTTSPILGVCSLGSGLVMRCAAVDVEKQPMYFPACKVLAQKYTWERYLTQGTYTLGKVRIFVPQCCRSGRWNSQCRCIAAAPLVSSWSLIRGLFGAFLAVKRGCDWRGIPSLYKSGLCRAAPYAVVHSHTL